MKNKISITDFIYKVYYWLNFRRGEPGWKERFVKEISKELKRVKRLEEIINEK